MTDNEIITIIKNSNTYTEVFSQAKLKGTTTDIRKINKLVKDNSLIVPFVKVRYRHDAQSYVASSTNNNRKRIAERLATLRGHICQVCQQVSFNNTTIPLTLTVTFKDGDMTNRDMDNILLLCLNCHNGLKFSDQYRQHQQELLKDLNEYNISPE